MLLLDDLAVILDLPNNLVTFATLSVTPGLSARREAASIPNMSGTAMMKCVQEVRLLQDGKMCRKGWGWKRSPGLGTAPTARRRRSRGYSKLWYTRGDVGSQAFAQGAIGEEEPAQVTADDYSSSLGPWTQVNIPAVGAPLLACSSISSEAGALATDPDPARAVKTFGVVRFQSVWPARVRTLEALEHFLNGGDMLPRLSEQDVAEDPTTAPDGAGLDLSTSEVLCHSSRGAHRPEKDVCGAWMTSSSLEQTTAPADSSAAQRAPAWAPQLSADGERASLQGDETQHFLLLGSWGGYTQDFGCIIGEISPKRKTAPTQRLLGIRATR